MNWYSNMPNTEVASDFGECCGKPEQGETEEYLRITELFRPLARRLTKFIDETLGPKGIFIALMNFLGQPDNMEWQEMRGMGSFLTAHQVLLYNWTVFNLLYRPIPIDKSDPGTDLPADVTLSELFLDINKDTLSESEKELIRAISRKPFTIAEVKQCTKDHCIIVRDIFKRQETQILDAGLSRLARQGDIYYCRIIRINNLSFLFNAYSPFAIPNLNKPFIIALRKAIREESHGTIGDHTLLEYEAVIRKGYLELCKGLFRPVVVVRSGSKSRPIPALTKLHQNLLRFRPDRKNLS